MMPSLILCRFSSKKIQEEQWICGSGKTTLVLLSLLNCTSLLIVADHPGSQIFQKEFPFGFNTGIFIKAIIIAEIVFIKQEIHLLTAIAAKDFVIGLESTILAGFAAMVTGHLYCSAIN